MGIVNKGPITATIMTRYAIDSGFSKLGVIPGGGGSAPIMVSGVGAIVKHSAISIKKRVVVKVVPQSKSLGRKSMVIQSKQGALNGLLMEMDREKWC